jgi:PPIC-type PPIASE domain
MRRLGLVVVVLAMAGCTALRDAFTAHPAAAAEAAGQRLSVERLANVASRIKGMPLKQENLGRVAGVYVDYMLFAMALVQGENLDDSTIVAHAMWPLVAQLRFDHFVERVRADRALTPAEIDSTYASGDLRAFQHILITVPPSAAPPVVQQKQSQITGLLRALQPSGGANFAAVAKRSSEDPGSKVSGGYLEVGPRGRFVPQFEDAAWQLDPGAMSGVVRTAYGFHIIRRPPLAEIRDTFAAGVRQILASRKDSTYFADLATRRHVQVTGGAVGDVRAAMEDLNAAGRSNKRLASFDGGTFAMKDFVRWLYSIDPAYAQRLPSASDSLVRSLVEQMAERTAALSEADSAGVQLSDSEWTSIRTEYDSTVAILRDVLQLDSAMLQDSATTPEGRVRFAMTRVDQYFDRVVSQQAPFRQVPPLLAQALRERADWSLDPSGIRSAAQRAVALRATADSLNPPGAGNRGSGLRPAPGPAPLSPSVDSALKRPPDRRIVE